MTLNLALYCLAIALASALGGVLPLVTHLTHTRMQVFLSFAAGVMLGAVFFHMLPDAVAQGGSGTLKWTCLGLLSLFFLERFFSFHQHEVPQDHQTHAHEGAHQGAELHWGVAAVGLAAHTLVGGFALASAVAASTASDRSGTAWGVFLATLLHKPADSLTIVSLMVRSGTSRTYAHIVNFAYALLVPLGVAGFFIFRDAMAVQTQTGFTTAALAFSGGTFLCIALSDLLPELQFHKHDRLALSVALLLGLGLMAVSGMYG
jgi:zinc and cadmium transporter